MAQENVNAKLAAVVGAGVVGYRRLTCTVFTVGLPVGISAGICCPPLLAVASANSGL